MALDLFHGQVVLLLSCDGTNGSTSLVDSSPYARTLTAISGAVLSTTAPKFGSASLSLPGSGATVTAPSAPELALQGDFTVELWVKTTQTADGWILGYYQRNPGVATQQAWMLITFGGTTYFDILTTGDNLASFGATSAIADGQWHHLAACRSGNSVYCFVDGALKSTTTITVTPNNPASSELIIGGVAGSAEDAWVGSIDDLRITAGVARYIRPFIPPATSLVDDIPPSGDPLFSSVGTLLNFAGANNATSITDVGPYALPYTRVGNAVVSTAQSKFGGSSGYFHNTSGCFHTPASSALGLGTGDFTVEAWLYYTGATTGGYNTAFLLSPESGGNPHVQVRVADAGFAHAMQAVFGGTGSDVVSTGYTRTTIQNQWIHVAITRHRGTIRVFVGGALVGSTLISYDLTASCKLVVGAALSTPSDIWEGYVDDLRVTKGVARYTTTFTPPSTAHPTVGPYAADPFIDKVALHLPLDGTNAGQFIPDFSPLPKTITVSGNAALSTAQSKYGSASLALDGSGDVLAAADHPDLNLGSSDFTIEFWIRLTTFSGQMTLVAKRANGSTGTFLLYKEGGSGQLRAFAESAPGAGWNTLNNAAVGTIPSIGVWHHVALVRSGTKFYGAVNGSVTQIATSSNAIGATTSAMYVGGDSDSNYTSGFIDDFRLTKGVARYTASFTPPTAALPAGGADPLFGNVTLLLSMDGTNGSTTFTDSSSSPKTVTVTGTAALSTAQSRFGGASGYFDATTSELSVADSTEMRLGTGDWAVEGWMYYTRGTTGSFDVVFALGTGNDLVGLRFADAGYGYALQLLSYNGAVTVANATHTRTTLLNVWTHWAVTCCANTMTLWINGVSAATLVRSASLANGLFTLGNYPGFSQRYAGYLDDVRLTKGVARYPATAPLAALPTPTTASNDPYFNRVALLLPFEGVDNSRNIVDVGPVMRTGLAVVNDAKLSNAQFKHNERSLYLDGAADWVDVPYSSDFDVHAGDFTIEGWFYSTSTVHQSLLCNRSNSANGWVLANDSVRGRINGVWSDTHISWTRPTANAWHHYALVRAGSVLSVYVDGVLVGTKTGVTSIETNGGQPIRIGSGDQGGEAPFYGYIDDFRWTTGSARYTAAFTPPGPLYTPNSAPQTSAATGSNLTVFGTPVSIAGPVLIGATSFAPVTFGQVVAGYTQYAGAGTIPAVVWGQPGRTTTIYAWSLGNVAVFGGLGLPAVATPSPIKIPRMGMPDAARFVRKPVLRNVRARFVRGTRFGVPKT